MGQRIWTFLRSFEAQWQVNIQLQSARTTWHRGVARKPLRQKYSDDPMRPAKSDEVSALLIGVLAKSLSGPCVNETPPEKGIVFPFYLNSPLFPFLSHTFNSFIPHSKMSSVARAIRPFASRVLAQKPIAPICQASPAFRFPRGTRTFSQSPLCEYPAPQMLFRAAWRASKGIATSK